MAQARRRPGGGMPVHLEVAARVLLDTVAALRARLFAALEGLSPAEWEAPSRCAGWTVKDVVGHLCWAYGVGGEMLRRAEARSEERLFEGFDPRVTPQRTLEPLRAHSPAELVAELRSRTGAMMAVARRMLDGGVEAEADTPLGWLDWRLAVNHGFWDSWLHERDILVPLGRAPAPDPVEVRLAGSYELLLLGRVLAFGGAWGTVDLRLDGPGGGAYRLRVDPGLGIAVDHPEDPPAGGECLVGDAISTIEAISGRGGLDSVHGPEPLRLRIGVLGAVLAGT